MRNLTAGLHRPEVSAGSMLWPVTVTTAIRRRRNTAPANRMPSCGQWPAPHLVGCRWSGVNSSTSSSSMTASSAATEPAAAATSAAPGGGPVTTAAALPIRPVSRRMSRARLRTRWSRPSVGAVRPGRTPKQAHVACAFVRTTTATPVASTPVSRTAHASYVVPSATELGT
jgi:hypothetical protein